MHLNNDRKFLLSLIRELREENARLMAMLSGEGECIMSYVS